MVKHWRWRTLSGGQINSKNHRLGRFRIENATVQDRCNRPLSTAVPRTKGNSPWRRQGDAPVHWGAWPLCQLIQLADRLAGCLGSCARRQASPHRKSTTTKQRFASSPSSDAAFVLLRGHTLYIIDLSKCNLLADRVLLLGATWASAPPASQPRDASKVMHHGSSDNISTISIGRPRITMPVRTVLIVPFRHAPQHLSQSFNQGKLERNLLADLETFAAFVSVMTVCEGP